MVKLLNEVGNVKSCKVSIGSSFNWADFSVQVWLIRSKGDPYPLEGPPT